MNKQLKIISLSILALACTQFPTILPTIAVPRQTIAANPISPESIARQIVVRVLVGDRRSSGTIIARQGNRYTILTNAHVTNKGTNYRITTLDGKTYPAKCAQPLKQGVCTADKSNDLALLEFTSSQTYTVPKWGDSRNLNPGETIYSAGFPFDEQALQIKTGKVNIQTNKPLLGGYQIGFNQPTAPGMSGGALLNAKGQLIGIIGFNSYPILNNGYQYLDGSQPAASEIAQWRKSSFAIPVATLAQIDRQYVALLPKNEGTTATNPIARTKYTGVIKRVDDIAQKITVRIDDKNGENGSGVIVAKQRDAYGDVYYVATAAHVVQKITMKDRRRLTNKIATAIITHTGERIALNDGDSYVANIDLDIAVVKFRPKQSYQVANIGQYEFDKPDWVFVSGFPGKNINPLQERKLTVGLVQDRSEKEFVVKNRTSNDGKIEGTLSRGNNLVYSNLSLLGMSGGAVLDRQGKLIGLNTGAENDRDGGAEINFGYGVGIPISTILGVTSQSDRSWQLPILPAQITKTPAPDSQTENAAIAEIQKKTVPKLSPTELKDTAKLLDTANLLWRSGQNQTAINTFERAIELLKADPDGIGIKDRLKLAYFGLGLAWIDEKNDRKAVTSFQNVVAKDVAPLFTPAWRYLGSVKYRLQDYQGAIAAYDTAISQQGNDFVLYVEKGDALSESAKTFSNRGDSINAAKFYREAVKSYKRAIEINPNHPWAYNNRGNSYNDQKEYSRAIADLTKAIALNPQDANAYNNRGNSYNGQKEYPRAIADLTKAIAINPQYAMAYNNRGNSYNDLKDYPRAIADYTKAIALNPQLAMAYNNRGYSYNDLKDYTRAIADLTKAIAINPQLANAYNNRGISYNDLKDYPRAIEDYTKAIAINPQLAEAYNNRGNSYKNLKDYPRAIADYIKAIALNPQYAEAYNNRGNSYNDLKDYPRAIADLTKAIALNPQYAEAYNNRGNSYNDLKEYPRAITDLTKAIALNPQYANAYYNRGNSYNELKEYPRAIEDYTKAIEINPQLVKAYNNRGISYYRQQDYSRAIEDYTKAITLNLQLAEAYNNRGISYNDLKEYPRAIADLTKAIALNPQLAEAYNNRGFSYEGLKDYARAIEDYTKAIALNPQFANAYNNRGVIYYEQKQYPQAKADIEKAAQLFRAQNDRAGYQRAIAALQQLKSEMR